VSGKPFSPVFLYPLVVIFYLALPSSTPAWLIIKLTFIGLVTGLMARHFIHEGQEQAARRKKEVAEQRTRELEAELGFEPLSFADLSDDEVNHMYEELKKEKGA
jgi:ABC-type transport system involved in cytochrome bd biosynthesis fused ATPase/permease subunit